jgi:hypothetical protein
MPTVPTVQGYILAMLPGVFIFQVKTLTLMSSLQLLSKLQKDSMGVASETLTIFGLKLLLPSGPSNAFVTASMPALNPFNTIPNCLNREWCFRASKAYLGMTVATLRDFPNKDLNFVSKLH